MYAQGAAVLRADIRGVVEETFLQSDLYIGPKVLPPLPVQAKSGQYPVIKKNAGNLLRNEVKARGAGGSYARVSRSYENDNYQCIEYGIEAVVDDSQRNDVSRFFSLEETETRFAMRQTQLAHEIRVKAKVFDPSVFSLSTAATAYTSGNLPSFDLGLDVDLAKQQIQGRGESVSDLIAVMSRPMFNLVRASTRLQNRIRGTISTDSQLVLDRQAVADALGLREVLVGDAVYDTSKQGASASVMANIWTDTYIWLGTARSGGGPDSYFNGSAGFTLFWEQDAAIFQAESYREEAIRSEIIRCRQDTDEKIVLAAAGQLLVTAGP